MRWFYTFIFIAFIGKLTNAQLSLDTCCMLLNIEDPYQFNSDVFRESQIRIYNHSDSAVTIRWNVFFSPQSFEGELALKDSNLCYIHGFHNSCSLIPLKVDPQDSVMVAIWSYDIEDLSHLDSLGETFYLEILNDSCTEVLFTVPIILNYGPTSTKNIFLDNYSIQPNPSSGLIYLKELNFVSHLAFNYSIYNVQGLMMQSGQIVDSSQEIDISNFESGMYLVRVLLKDGRTGVFKVIKS